VPVTTATELTAALADARPLDIIAVADGTYEGSFLAAAAGNANGPIALCGSANAILHGPSLTQGYTLYLQGAQYWEVVGLTVTGGAKGIMLDNAGHNLLKNLTVRSIGSEGIHLRTNSSDNLLDGCHVWQTGIAGDPMYGEGIYIGSSQTNWCTLTSGSADRSDRNIVQNCDVAQTTAECLDIKEGTTGGQILGNTLNGQGINLSAATSVVNIKGNQYLVQNNTVQHAPEDAFSVHVLLDGWGACNQFIANSANDTLTGYGVHLAAPKPWPAIEITSNNQFPLATSGISNAPLDGGVPPTHACQPSITTVTCDG
jgi:hypothetical protein